MLNFGTEKISSLSSISVENNEKVLPLAASMPLRKPHLFIAIFAAWGLLLLWFSPRLFNILNAARGPVSWFSLAYFAVFAQLAWLYGLYNIGVVTFAAIYRRQQSTNPSSTTLPKFSNVPVAILYTTCNDFMEASARSCVKVDYPNYKVYILDDSSDPGCMQRIDKFASRFSKQVQVVRRQDRRAFKAGNLNHALEKVAHEPLFAIVDADEILPPDFLQKLVPRLTSDPQCGFIQANHHCASHPNNQLKQDMQIGVDVHWKWYQPLRNQYGFVMFLGHGALLRRSCWQEIGGFPEIVSEDLAFAMNIRERGYYGVFAQDVVCVEEFPESVRAFRIRHVKWTRGTCELLTTCFRKLTSSKRIPLIEKLDILFPTLNLPLTFFFFLFMFNSGFVLPLTLGDRQDLTIEIGVYSLILPFISMPKEFISLFTFDFYLVTVVTILSPILCFILELWRTPWRLLRFLYHSTALYASLSPLSTICVFGYLVTGKARFLVTGDKNDSTQRATQGRSVFGLQKIRAFFSETHPDSWGVRLFETTAAVIFFCAALASFQVALIGLAIGFMLLPIMHTVGWNNSFARVMVWVPFSFILIGILLGGMGILGLQPVLFGFGFHF